MNAKKLREQFKAENPRDDLFTVFHVKWLERKLSQPTEGGVTLSDETIEKIASTVSKHLPRMLTPEETEKIAEDLWNTDLSKLINEIKEI